MTRAPELISEIMRRVRSENTNPERRLRSALWRRGLRFRLHSRQLAGKPDIIFPRARVVVFVDGDFWHGNQWQLRGLDSLEQQFVNSPNATYWTEKIRRNMARDERTTRSLDAAGWKVMRFWESRLAIDFERCVKEIENQVRREAGR